MTVNEIKAMLENMNGDENVWFFDRSRDELYFSIELVESIVDLNAGGRRICVFTDDTEGVNHY